MSSTLIAIKLKKYILLANSSQQNCEVALTVRSGGKFFSLSESIVCWYSGSVSDAQFTIDYIRSKILEYLTQANKKLSTRIVVQILREFCYNQKNFDCNFICAGWDVFHGNQIYLINHCGALFNQKTITSGISGCNDNFWFLEYKEEMDYYVFREFTMKKISIMVNSSKNTGGVIEICNINSHGIHIEFFVPFSRSNEFFFLKKLLFI